MRFFNLLMKSKQVPIAVSLSIAYSYAYRLEHNKSNYIYCDETKKHKNPEIQNISVYLKENSHSLLKSFLEKNGYKNKTINSAVYFVRNATKEQQYIYKPLYGKNVAFRLKGIIQINDEYIVGIGRVSSMIGELKDDDNVAFIPFTNKDISDDELQMALDLPNRMQKVINMSNYNYWKGKLPSSIIHNKTYLPIKNVSFLPLPLKKQIVLEGILSSDLYIDNNGNCTYDYSLDSDYYDYDDEDFDDNSIETNVINDKSDIKEISKLEPFQDIDNNNDNFNNEDECPLCKYIKAGSCKKEYIEFENCAKISKNLLKDCAIPSKVMLNCFMKDEYYDIFIAGIDMEQWNNVEAQLIAMEESNNNNNNNNNNIQDNINKNIENNNIINDNVNNNSKTEEK